MILALHGRAGVEPEMALSQCRRLARVLTMTREMLVLAEAGNWDAVADLERARREDLERCFAAVVDPVHSELVAEALAAILHINEELMCCLASARDAVLQQGVVQVRTRSAIHEYEAVRAEPWSRPRTT